MLFTTICLDPLHGLLCQQKRPGCNQTQMVRNIFKVFILILMTDEDLFGAVKVPVETFGNLSDDQLFRQVCLPVAIFVSILGKPASSHVGLVQLFGSAPPKKPKKKVAPAAVAAAPSKFPMMLSRAHAWDA